MNREGILRWYAQEFGDIANELKGKDSISYLDFLRIRNFKLQTSTRESEDRIQKITTEAFSLAESDEIKEAIKKLLELHGVAIPIASTILAMRFPDKYAIIDERVLRQLGKTEWLKDYLTNPEIYEKYILFMRETKPEGVSLREYERSLFEKDRKA